MDSKYWASTHIYLLGPACTTFVYYAVPGIRDLPFFKQCQSVSARGWPCWCGRVYL